MVSIPVFNAVFYDFNALVKGRLQIDAVNDVLSDIDGVETIPTIVAFNKADRT